MIMEDDKLGSLEEEALKRKERLAALKRKRTKTQDCDPKEPTLPRPKFRSYAPVDDELKEASLETAKPVDVTEEVRDQLEAAKTPVLLQELDLTSLAPRKADWDLKRDLAKKLEKLERRTQRAIAELIRERLKTGQTDLAAAVSIGAQAEAHITRHH